MRGRERERARERGRERERGERKRKKIKTRRHSQSANLHHRDKQILNTYIGLILPKLIKIGQNL